MAHLLAQVALGHDSGLPEDVTINTWHFSGDDTPTVANALHLALYDFYHAANTQGTVESRLSSLLSGAMTIKWYNLDDATPRVPFHTTTATITPGSTALPGEVAVVLSFQGAQVSGLPQASRRGRVFIGPLANTNGISGVLTSNSDPTIHANFRTDLLVAAQRLKTAAEAASAPWHVFSPKLGSSTPVTNGWVDNACDTQRRRGVRATTRTTDAF